MGIVYHVVGILIPFFVLIHTSPIEIITNKGKTWSRAVAYKGVSLFVSLGN